MKARNWILALVVLLVALPIFSSDEMSREAEAARIETMLMSPCCWRQPVSEHQSDISKEMKASIRQMLAAGRTREAIVDHYVELYGARILSIPPQQGFNRMSLLMPAFFGLGALVVVLVVLRNWRGASSGASGAVNEEMSARIESELEHY